jgi:hypothetical protein
LAPPTIQCPLSVRIDAACVIRKKGIEEFKKQKWKFRTFGPPYIPKQEDNVSCGVYALCVADLLR